MQTTNRVVINTLFQYLRLVLNVVIGLYSVRIILNALGASDYGIFDLIYGVVGLMGVISSSLSQTSLRYLSVHLGKGDNLKTKQIFSVCFWLHFLIASFLSLILFFVGFFLFEGLLNIPEERIGTAHLLYYTMVLGLFLNIAVTPFNAMIMAHEKFVFLSCVQIFDSLCKLGIAFVIAATTSDRLLLYGILIVVVTVVNVLCYIFFAGIYYRDKMSIHIVGFVEMKEVGGFAGWTLLDIIGSVATRQGYAILINSFFGTVLNAVFALARQIEQNVYTISASVIDSIKPQIMKSHGAGNTNRMFRLSLTAGKFGFAMMSLIAIPLLVMIPEILTLWLHEVPEGTILFTRLMVAACMSEQLTRGLVYANQAIGNIKWFSIIVSSIRFIALPISWLLFYFGAPSYVAIVVFFICETFGSFIRVFIMAFISEFKAISFIQSVLLQLLVPFIISILICIFSYHFLKGVWGILAVCVITALTYLILLLFFGLTEEENLSIHKLVASTSKRILGISSMETSRIVNNSIPQKHSLLDE